MRDKEGNKLSTTEYIGRWKQGIQAVTPLQITQINLFGYWIVIAGILIGLVTSWQTKTWWLFVVLCGSLIVSSTSILGAFQKYFVLKRIEEQLQGGVESNEMEQESTA